MEDRQKYNGMELLLQQINTNFSSLSKETTTRNNEILNSIITQIIDTMKQKDRLFKEMFSEIFYGGSFYDGLKVRGPDEYDLDVLLTLPHELEFKLEVATNVPGFVHLKFSNYTPCMQKLDLTGKHKGMDKLMNTNHYLDTSQVLKWIQRIVQKVLNCLKRDSNGWYIFETPRGIFYVKVSQSRPAVTLKATGTVKGKQVKMNIDLVPCFVFPKEQWPRPEGGFRINPVNQTSTFFIVPKRIKGMKQYSAHYWRLSFQEQERELLDNKATLKSTIKLLKKMRGRLQHKKIASYYIKTVALWTIDEKKSSFWNDNSLSYVFMTVLKNYQKFLQTGKIPYYWNKNYNLLEEVNQQTLVNISNKIKVVIDDIENHLDDPFIVVAKYIVKRRSVRALKKKCGRK